MIDGNIIKKLIKMRLKKAEEESYNTEYGEGYKAGKIEELKKVLKLIP